MAGLQLVTRTAALLCYFFFSFKRHKDDHEIDLYKLVFFGHVLLAVPVIDARLVPGAA